MPQFKSRTNRGFINWRAGAGARGPQNVDESITLGVGAAFALSPQSLAQASIALGVAAATAAPAAGEVSNQAITLGVETDVVFAGERNTAPQPITVRIALGAEFTDSIHFGTIRRGNSAVKVTPKSSGKVTVR